MLGVDGRTVKAHVNALLAKLGVRDRVQATIVAYDLGLVRPGVRGRTVHDRRATGTAQNRHSRSARGSIS